MTDKQEFEITRSYYFYSSVHQTVKVSTELSVHKLCKAKVNNGPSEETKKNV